MGNSLIATSALAFAGALAAGPALAADKLSVGVGGFMQQWFGMANRDDDGADGGWAVQSDSEIHLKGSLDSDMGLKYTVHVELKGDGGAEPVDESFLRVSGGFGQIELGARDHAMVRMHSGISDVGIGLTSGDTQKWIPGTYLETAGHGSIGGGNDQKLNYISPRVSGLQIGVSYAPKEGAGTTEMPAGNDESAWGAGLNFQQEVGDMAVTFSLGHRSVDQTGEQMVDTSGRNHLCGLTKQNTEGGVRKYAANGNTNCDQLTIPAREKGTTIAAATSADDHFIPALTSKTEADAGTYTNAGVGISFGAFKFNVAYATADGGAYKVEQTPIMYAVDPDATPASGTNLPIASADASDTEVFTADRVASTPSTATDADERLVTGAQFNWGADGKMGGTGVNVDAAASALVPEHKEDVVKDKSQDATIWGVSVTWTEGPMALSLGHMTHEADDGGERVSTMLSGSYTMAPGVAWKTSVFAVEDTTDHKDVTDGMNEGTGFVTGITIGF